jgi:hypothetical protein
MTKEIQLTQGKIALVDDEDFEYLSQWKWHFSNGYAARTVNIFHNKIWMHREVMKTPPEMDTDHIDSNGLNNQKYNLRICTPSQNSRNRKKRKDIYKGVGITANGKWQASLMKDGVYVLRKTFDTPEAAARAYDEAARKHHGEFASTNFNEKDEG